MTNNVSSINPQINSTRTPSVQPNQMGQSFSNILQAKMNSSAMSIGNFDNLSDNSSEESFGGLNSNGNGGNMFNGFGLGSLSNAGNSSSVNGGKFGSDTMLMVIMLALMLGSGDGQGSQAMLTSLTDSLMGGNNYRRSLAPNMQTGAFSGVDMGNSAYKSTYVTPGSGSYPSSMGKPCSPNVVNNVGNRSPQAYNSVIRQFNVEDNSRYTPYKNGSTYCNIYVWDVTTAMGAQIPHRVDENGDIAAPGTKNVKYMTANSMYNWLGDKGKEYGWKEVSAEEAQRYANMGCPSVAAWKNPKGHGHIQMVVPSQNGQYSDSKGVAISQAGSKVIEYGYISDVYKSSRLNDIKYFVHA